MTMRALATVLMLVLCSCGFSSASRGQDDMNRHAAVLTKLSSLMESYIRYGNPPIGASSDELLALGSKDQPDLMRELAQFNVKVLSQDAHAVILVCTKSGDRALLEDAGCTGKLDARHWERADVPCRFTLSVQAACNQG